MIQRCQNMLKEFVCFVRADFLTLPYFTFWNIKTKLFHYKLKINKMFFLLPDRLNAPHNIQPDGKLCTAVLKPWTIAKGRRADRASVSTSQRRARWRSDGRNFSQLNTDHIRWASSASALQLRCGCTMNCRSSLIHQWVNKTYTRDYNDYIMTIVDGRQNKSIKCWVFFALDMNKTRETTIEILQGTFIMHSADSGNVKWIFMGKSSNTKSYLLR